MLWLGRMFGAERRPGDPLERALAAWNAGDHGGALDLWAPRAHRGDARAQSNMSAAFLEGLGVERDPKKAVDWAEAGGAGELAAGFLRLARAEP